MTNIRFIPDNARKIEDKLCGAVAYLYERNGHPCALVYPTPKHTKAQSYRFQRLERRQEWVAAQLVSARKIFEYKATRQAERKAVRAKPNSLEIGHILVSTWGYEQTNVTFYQVTAKPSKCFVEVRRIGNNHVTDGANYTGTVIPDLDKASGDPIRVRADASNTLKIGHQYARLWDGRPVWYSSYA